jgi:hypothetical protein
VTVKVCPAIVTVPLRWLVAVFDETDILTVPLPLPDAPEVIEIQPTLLDALQAQPLVAVTLVLVLPPIAPIDALVGAIE